VPILIPAALPATVGAYVGILAVGFIVGIAGHVTRSRTLILSGILIVGVVSVVFAFGVGKLS
jgi:hypothetical protein